MCAVDTNGLAPLEIASSVVFGADEAADALHSSNAGTAREALEESLLRALLRPPCVVAFSGGRDSSALLACAVQVARREGLAPPIPVTLRFSGMPETVEEEWQTLAIGHIGLSDWVRHEFSDELDIVGPVAAREMQRNGLPYPFNLHLFAPLIDDARGGSLVTGHGGDQMLTPAGRPLDVLARRTRPTVRDLKWIGVHVGPRAIRRSVLRSRVPALGLPWLRSQARSQLERAWLEDHVCQPLRWDKRLLHMWRSRFMGLTARRFESFAAAGDVTAFHPLAEAEFALTLAREAGATGFATRTSAMETLFGDLLPDELISRGSKASFQDVFWNRHARSFLDGIGEGELELALATLGLDAIVDPRALAAHWAGSRPMANSFLLLQACWLAQR